VTTSRSVRNVMRTLGPTLSEGSTKLDIVRALNWAAQELDLKDLETFVSQYMATVGYTPAQIAHARRSESLLTPTDYALCRLGVVGSLPTAAIAHLRRQLEQAVDGWSEVVASKRRARLVPRHVSHLRDVIGFLDGQVDLVVASDKPALISPYAFLSEQNLSPQQLAAVSSWVEDAIEKHESLDTPDVAVYYNLRFKRRFRAIQKYLNLVQTDVDTLHGNAKRARKARTGQRAATPSLRETRNMATAVGALTYLSECVTTRVRSLNPQRVFGSTAAVLFNAKTNTIHLLRATSGQTLTIKGQSIVGVDESLSISRRVKQASRYVPQLAKASFEEVVRIVESVLKTKPNRASSKITSSTVIVSTHTV